MPRRYSAREIARALERIGFLFVRQSGSHMRYSGQWRGVQRHVTLVAGQRQVPPPTLAAILEQASIKREELDRLMRGESISE